MQRPALLLLTILLLCGSAFGEKLTIYTEEFPPFNFMHDSKIKGASTEIITQVLKLAGIEYNLLLTPWARAYYNASNKPNSLIYSISRLDSRERHFIWIGEIAPVRYSVYTLKQRTDIKINQLMDMKNFVIGTTINDARDTYLLNHGFHPKDLERLMGQGANHRNYEKLKLGRIELWPMPNAVANLISKDMGDDPKKVLRKVFDLKDLSKQGYYLAASKQTSKAMIDKIKISLQKFKKTPEYQAILTRWGLL